VCCHASGFRAQIRAANISPTLCFFQSWRPVLVAEDLWTTVVKRAEFLLMQGEEFSAGDAKARLELIFPLISQSATWLRP
jgi:hypothetical protein